MPKKAKKTLATMTLAKGETDTGKRKKCWQCKQQAMIVKVKGYGEQPRCPNDCGPEALGRMLSF